MNSRCGVVLFLKHWSIFVTISSDTARHRAMAAYPDRSTVTLFGECYLKHKYCDEVPLQGDFGFSMALRHEEYCSGNDEDGIGYDTMR